MINYFNCNGITYDRTAKEYQFRLVSASGEKSEIPLKLGRELVLSIGQGKRCMSTKPNGQFCMERIGPTEKICSDCRLQEDTCVYGATKLLWSSCPKNPTHVCFDRVNYTNYLASYGLVQTDGSLDVKSGISVNAGSRVRRGGYSFVAFLKPNLETQDAQRGATLPLASLHEVMIPAIASTNHLPVPASAEHFTWSDAISKNLTNVNVLDESGFDHFTRQVTTLMEAVWRHCDDALSKSIDEQWQALRLLLEAVPKQGAGAMQQLYDSIRSSPLFLGESDLLSLTITDIYRSLRAKTPVVRYIVHQATDIEVIRELKRLSEGNEPRKIMTRVRNKPEDLQVKGKILMVRGETLIVQSSDNQSKPHMYRFERLSRGRPIVTWTNLSGVSVSAEGDIAAQMPLETWS